jgi:uncharacterized protein (TIGR04168 family)
MQIAIIGDIHTFWTDFDTRYFNASDYDLILICGDLPGRLHRKTLHVARALSGLKKPALMIPGNHDATTVRQNLGEILKNQTLIGTSGAGQLRRVLILEKVLHPVVVGGYSLHTIGDYDIIMLRPHSIGGPGLAFLPYLRERFQVTTIEESAEKIKKLIDCSRHDIIFLGHNGPGGLGSHRSDIFGCDFRKEMGDFGDEDAEIALNYALQQGKRVRAFVAGHMHHRLRGGGNRIWTVEREGIHFINAARVPRIYRNGKTTVHHHVRLCLSKTETTVEEILIQPEEQHE